MNKLKQWIDAAVDAFLRGIRGEAPPTVDGKPVGVEPLIVRDCLLTLIELVLTASAIFAFLWASNNFVKAVLALAIAVSVMRVYRVAAQLWDTIGNR